VESDFSVFHREDDIYSRSCRWVVPKLRLIYSYKGAVRFKLEQDAEEERRDKEPRKVESSFGTADAYDDPSKNTEAMAAGIFEVGSA
jgi:hypothetical protein